MLRDTQRAAKRLLDVSVKSFPRLVLESGDRAHTVNESCSHQSGQISSISRPSSGEQDTTRILSVNFSTSPCSWAPELLKASRLGLESSHQLPRFSMLQASYLELLGQGSNYILHFPWEMPPMSAYTVLLLWRIVTSVEDREEEKEVKHKIISNTKILSTRENSGFARRRECMYWGERSPCSAG